MWTKEADQKDIARRYEDRLRSAKASRILENEIVFNVVGTIGLILFIGVLALWALARFVRGATSRLVHRLSGSPPSLAHGHDPAGV
jgi:hypothetical protein